MSKITFILAFFLAAVASAFSQELNCTVNINSEQVQGDRSIFTPLKSAITELLNNTQWTNKQYASNEKIDCNINLIFTNLDNNSFTGMIQVQSSRPIYGTSYNSPVLNIMDNNFSFTYTANEPLIYNENSYTSELVAILSFYAHIIIGVDSDTFKQNGGQYNLDKAQNILSYSQQSSNEGWKQSGKAYSRYTIITDLTSNYYSEYRNALYHYHLKGLDLLSTSPLEAKKNIKKGIDQLASIAKTNPNAVLIRLFFDAKANEIAKIFSAGVEFSEKQNLIETLNKISNLNRDIWNKI